MVNVGTAFPAGAQSVELVSKEGCVRLASGAGPVQRPSTLLDEGEDLGADWVLAIEALLLE